MDYCCAIRGILNGNQGGPTYPAGLRMRDALKKVRRSLQVNMDLGREIPSHAHTSRLAGCVDRGFEATADDFKHIRRGVKQVKVVEKTLDPEEGNSKEREEAFDALREDFSGKQDAVSQHMAKVMESFKPGLFSGGDDVDIPDYSAQIK